MSVEDYHTRIYVARHGRPEYAYQVTPTGERKRLIYGSNARLSTEGKKQAEELADRIPQLDSIYSSTFERARQTAQIIAEKQGGLFVKEIPELVDILAEGAIGLPLDDVLQGRIIPPSLPTDETLEQLEKRTVPAFEKIFAREKGKTTGIVGHGHGIRLMALRVIERKRGMLPPISDLEQYNYLNPGEAWFLAWDEQGKLVHHQILTRPETKVAGKRHS